MEVKLLESRRQIAPQFAQILKDSKYIDPERFTAVLQAYAQDHKVAPWTRISVVDWPADHIIGSTLRLEVASILQGYGALSENDLRDFQRKELQREISCLSNVYGMRPTSDEPQEIFRQAISTHSSYQWFGGERRVSSVNDAGLLNLLSLIAHTSSLNSGNLMNTERSLPYKRNTLRALLDVYGQGCEDIDDNRGLEAGCIHECATQDLRRYRTRLELAMIELYDLTAE